MTTSHRGIFANFTCLPCRGGVERSETEGLKFDKIQLPQSAAPPAPLEEEPTLKANYENIYSLPLEGSRGRFLLTSRHDVGIVPYGFVPLSSLIVGCDDHIAPRNFC